MKADNSVIISLSAYIYGSRFIPDDTKEDKPHPRDIESPSNVINRAWMPQTMMDCIWIFYEFATTEERDAFIESPPAVFDEAGISTNDQGFYDHWVNG